MAAGKAAAPLVSVRTLAREGMTMIVVTHEIAFARDVCDRVVFMADGDIVEEGLSGSVFSNRAGADRRVPASDTLNPANAGQSHNSFQPIPTPIQPRTSPP